MFKALLICYYSRAHAARERAAGSEAGTASATDLARLTGLDVAYISRRNEAATSRVRNDPELYRTIASVLKRYEQQTI